MTTHKILILAGVTGALVAPVAARADAPPADQQNAAQECRFERGTTAATREAFALHYGTNANHRNAFGKCVSARTRDEAQERTDAEANAPQACRDERGTTAESRAAFAAKYGTNKNGRNAFGKCVSAKARELEQAADVDDRDAAKARKSAAKQCDEERGDTAETRAAFRQKYGKGKHGANAFGKCVSQLARAQEEQDS